MDDLDLGGVAPDWDADPIPARDRDECNRWLWRIGRLDDEAAEVRAIAAAERERIDDWEADQLGLIERQRSWLARSCTSLLAAVRRDTGDRTKSIDLPNGKVVSHGRQPEWDYVDADRFLAWANDHADGLVNRPEPPPEQPARAEAKKTLVLPFGEPGDTVVPQWPDPDTGELVDVPGVTVTYRPPKFDVAPR